MGVRVRHCFVGLTVVEAMAAITIADALLMNMGARMDRITDFYKKL